MMRGMREKRDNGPSIDELDEVKGVVVTVVQRRDDWAVIEIQPEGGKPWDTITAVGSLPSIREGHQVTVRGRHRNGPRGPRFEVDRRLCAQVSVPTTAEGVAKWLCGFRGFGPHWAQKIIDHFGPEPEKVIKTLHEDPKLLLQVPGLAKIAERIMPVFEQEIGHGELQSLLFSVGLSAGLVRKVIDTFGPKAGKIVAENPYQMIGRVRGVGFDSADKIAKQTGVTPESLERIAAGLEHLLDEARDEGHCFIPRFQLTFQAAGLLSLHKDTVDKGLSMLLKGEGDTPPRLVQAEKAAIYRGAMLRAEKLIAADLTARLAKGDYRPLPPEVYDWWKGQTKTTLSAGQEAAVFQAIAKRVLIITGGAGTGKTTTLRAIVEILGALDLKIQGAAPTGRAAKRAEQVTRRNFMTIHRLTGAKGEYGEGKERGPNELLTQIDTLIIDEMSMVDIPLLAQLLRATPPKVQIIMVGDPNQLPSIGPGRILADLIESGVIPVAALTEVYRQAAESGIIRGATAINQGDMPELKPWTGVPTLGGLHFLEAEDPEDVMSALEDAMGAVLRTEKAPGVKYTLDDMQVIVPQRTTEIGTQAINARLQAHFNPDGAPLPGRPYLRVGDKVMQVVNNYDLDVMNGDVGYIRGFTDTEDGIKVIVAFYQGQDARGQDDWRTIPYGKENLGEIVLSNACSVHKLQGSEAPIIFMVVHSSHGYMLNRRLLYTAVTRGKTCVVLVGLKAAIERAVGNRRTEARNTRLLLRLQEQAKAAKLPTFNHQVHLSPVGTTSAPVDDGAF